MKIEEWTYMDPMMKKNGKQLKTGYTTGSFTTAACKSAVDRLFNDNQNELVTIDAPIGWKLHIKCHFERVSSIEVITLVQKDYSDDPDVTKGIHIYARARKSLSEGIHITTGLGVGIVTKEGLSVPVGQPAINPVPMAMILTEVGKVLPKGKGVDLLITIPEGVKIAKKTFNAKLGIIGGISILGTTGIVEPMSQDAYTDSLQLELRMSTLYDKEGSVFVFGNFGLDYLDQLINQDGSPESVEFPRHKTQKTSNFVDCMMKSAKELKIKRILYVGHAGKMVKVAYGMNNTHSKYGDHRMESIFESCKDLDWIGRGKILNSNTTDEAVAYLKSEGKMNKVFNDVANRCKEACELMANHQVEVECMVFTTIEGTIGTTKNALKLLKEIQND